MTGWDVRLVVAPLQVFFAGKLLVTGVLLRRLIQGWTDGARHPYWPLVAVLAGLAALQLVSLVGITFRRSSGRRLGVGLCIVGGTVGVIVCLLAPLAWVLGPLVVRLGLVLAILNGAALTLLTSASARDWCDE